jgi:hypothetical protein
MQGYRETIGWMIRRAGSATIAKACSLRGGGSITAGYVVRLYR